MKKIIIITVLVLNTISGYTQNGTKNKSKTIITKNDTVLVKLTGINCSDEGCFLDAKTIEGKDIQNTSFEFKTDAAFNIIIKTEPANIINNGILDDKFVDKNAKLICTKEVIKNLNFKSYIINKIIVYN